MAAVPPPQRHAYEVVRAVPCYAYFDLERTGSQYELEQAGEQAAEVARLEARDTCTSRSRRCWAPLFVSASVFARLGTRRQKFSRHLVLQAYTVLGGDPMLLAGPYFTTHQFPVSSSRLPSFQFPASSFQLPALLLPFSSFQLPHSTF